MATATLYSPSALATSSAETIPGLRSLRRLFRATTDAATSSWAEAFSLGATLSAWSFALRRLSAVAVAPFGYLIPVSALSISHIWLGEPLTVPTLVGAAMVLCGVGLTQARQLRLLLRAESRSATFGASG